MDNIFDKEKIDGRIDQPNTLIEKVGEILTKYGAENFLNGNEEECHKGREAFFAYFFIICFRRLSKKDWWIYQPEEFPDLCLISFAEHLLSMEALQYELVTIPNHYGEVKEMVKNVTDKIEKKNYAFSAPCGLLVFSNNAHSNAFEAKLYEALDKIHPFTEVWTMHLEFLDSVTINKIVVSKISPSPVIRFEFDYNDQSLYMNQEYPNCMEQVEEYGIKFLRIKKEALVEFRKEAIRRRLSGLKK